MIRDFIDVCDHKSEDDQHTHMQYNTQVQNKEGAQSIYVIRLHYSLHPREERSPSLLIIHHSRVYKQ